MRCECGKFMRRDSLTLDQRGCTVEWKCRCGKTKDDLRWDNTPTFSRDALALVTP